MLRGWAATLFWDNPGVGLLVLLAVFLNPWAGATALLACLAATLAARAFRTEPALVKTGMYGLNGVLVGMVATWFVPARPLLLPGVAAAAVLTVPMTSLWLEKVSARKQLPVLTLPFLALTWFMFAVLSPLEPTSSVNLYYHLGWTARLEARAWETLPRDVTLFFQTLSWLLFQQSVVLGALVFALLLWRSRVMAFMAFAGYIVGLAMARLVGGNALSAVVSAEVSAAFNGAFVAACLGGLFIRLNLVSAGYALVGAAMASLLTIWVSPLFVRMDLPVLNGPFTAVTLVFLAVARSPRVKRRAARLLPVPLDRISTPEALLDFPRFWRKSDHLRLTLPFYGIWYVSQGIHGLLTHFGNSSYAWDFVVLDKRGRSCGGLGRKAEDYFAWNLPVLAPAAGTVVRVRDNVRDNIPPEVNAREQWGNCVVIDHGDGLYSELSHFRQKGIVVREGDLVAQGQILGYLGNSGMSMEPHLHYQLQVGPEPGAKTAPAKFRDYYYHNGVATFHVKQGAPQQGQLISNHASPNGLAHL